MTVTFLYKYFLFFLPRLEINNFFLCLCNIFFNSTFFLSSQQPYESVSVTSGSAIRDPKNLRRDSRPNTPPQPLNGPLENGHEHFS